MKRFTDAEIRPVPSGNGSVFLRPSEFPLSGLFTSPSVFFPPNPKLMAISWDFVE